MSSIYDNRSYYNYGPDHFEVLAAAGIKISQGRHLSFRGVDCGIRFVAEGFRFTFPYELTTRNVKHNSTQMTFADFVIYVATAIEKAKIENSNKFRTIVRDSDGFEVVQLND